MQKHHFKKVALQDETSENFKRKRKRDKKKLYGYLSFIEMFMFN